MTYSDQKRLRHTTALTALAVSLALAVAPMAQADNKVITFDIPAENAAKALNDYSKQAGLQIIFPYDVAAKFEAPELKGAYTRDAALQRILAVTNLEIASADEAIISLRVRTKAETSASEPSSELVVTGTHIRGGNPTSPVRVLSRKEIEQSGYSQTADLMRSLPENFSGGQNNTLIEGASSNANPNNSNLTNASTMNLRGLGSDATLVLLNGHRLSADSIYQSSDISGIPLGAIQSIEVVTDGSSALYGADAVAGVVNFKLRRNFNGAEASARIGKATQGGGYEETSSMLGGLSRDIGYVILSAETSKQKAITWGDRDITAVGSRQNSLQQPQRRSSVFLGAGLNIGPYAKLTFDGLTSDRKAQRTFQVSPTSAQVLTRRVTPAYSAALTFDLDLPNAWRLSVSKVFAGSRNSARQVTPSRNRTVYSFVENKHRDLEGFLSGPLLDLPSGTVKIVLGGGHRSEELTTTTLAYARTVDYLFGEALVPLVSASATRAGLKALEVSLATRSENYSDFGRSANPKVGLRWVPTTGWTVRGTWGKSFKAPRFFQTNAVPELYLWDASFFGISGGGTVLNTDGGNPKLQPEKATSRTFGVDYKPQAATSISATYFDIDYTGRILQPVLPIDGAFTNARFASFVERNPGAAKASQLYSSFSSFINFSSGAFDPADVVAVVYNQLTNATSQTVRGFDLSARQSFDLKASRLEAFANGTWMELKQQTIPGDPNAELSGTIFFPPKFRGRGGVTWLKGGLSTTAIINYIASETDNLVAPHDRIPSWSTVDLNVAYRVSARASILPGVRVGLAASNLLDRKAPYTLTPVGNSSPHVDSTNHSVVGRFVSLNLSKAW